MGNHFSRTLSRFKNAVSVRLIGAPGEIRTPDHLVRSQVLYPAELRAHAKTLFFNYTRIHSNCDGENLYVSIESVK